MRIIKNSSIFFAVLILANLGVEKALAQVEECGSIVYPVNFYYEGSEEEAYPVTDCANPFNRDEAPDFTYGLTIAEQSITEGGEMIIAGTAETVSGVSFIDHPDTFTWRAMNLFEHREDNFIAVALTIDDESQDDTKTSSSFTSALQPGTYTAVFTVETAPIFSSADGWWGKLLSYVVPTAEAFYADSIAVASLTFTVKVEEETGVSSVLFLPGIQASFLSKESFLGEDQVWPPNSLFSGDVEDLTMDAAGQSREDIYTTGIIDTTTGVGDIYGGFAAFMNSLVYRGDIAGWTPFAYDWRYSVDNIAKNGTAYREGLRSLIEEVEYLANNSFSHKVTIIGHSNGGLLAKALVRELAAQDKVRLVDKVILLASPQLGTPKAIGTILHGHDQTDALGGVIIDAHPTRAVINNMPGAYGLLPTQAYFEGQGESLVTFTAGESTAPYIATYGESITSFAAYQQFLRGEDELGRSVEGKVSEPAPANAALLDKAFELHQDDLDDWVAPAGVEVIEVVGTGLTTMKAVEYRDIVEDKCTSAGQAGVICTTDHYLKPYAKITAYGDGTVVRRSAEGYGGEKRRYFVNLKEINNIKEGKKYAHHNITEVPQLQNLYHDLITGTTTYETAYVSASHTEFSDEYDLEIIDSPVRILTTDTLGRQTGVEVIDGVRHLRNDIPNSQYFELGDTKYLIVPKGTVRETVLTGEDYGGYTLTTATLTSTDEQVVRTELVNASTTPSMRAVYRHDGTNYSSIVTDYENDGVVDTVTTLTGESIIEDDVVTYQQVREYIEALAIKKGDKKAWLVLLQLSEKAAAKKQKRFDLADLPLRLLEKLLHDQTKKGKLTATEETELREMLEWLIANN